MTMPIIKIRRVPARLTFETNPYDCNLGCPMCEVHSPYAWATGTERMDAAIIRAVFDELAMDRGGLEEVVTTPMGEPLLYEYLGGMVDLCGRHQVKLHVTTNGTFPAGDARHWAERFAGVGADVKVSINGAKQQTQSQIMPGSDLARVCENVRALASARDQLVPPRGMRMQLTMKVTFQRANVRELPDMVRLAYDVGFDRIRGSHLTSHFIQTDTQLIDRTTEDRLLFNRMITEARNVARTLEKTTGRAVLLSNFEPQSDTPTLGRCPYLGREATLAADGRFQPCCLPAALRPQVDFGCVMDQGLLHIWNGPRYREFCTQYTTYAECQRCSRRHADFQEMIG